MQHSGFILSSEMDFSESQVLQMSNFNFDLKEMGRYEGDETVVMKTITSEESERKEMNESISGGILHEKQERNLVKKLYMKDLEVVKESMSSININNNKPQRISKQKSDDRLKLSSNKQNNMPNQTHNHNNHHSTNHQPQPPTYSRRLIIHKNPSPCISPYRTSTPHSVQQSFNTTKIVQLQQELIQLRKQMGLKQSNWIKEKSAMLSKMEMVNLQVAQMKQRNNNLIQINQTLTQALGQSTKNQVIGEYERRVDEMGKEISMKNKKIQSLQQVISKLEKDKSQLSVKQKQDKQRIQHLSRTIQDYKELVKQSNQRKFQSDQKWVIVAKNIQLIKVKLNQLPIKNQYLKPVFVLLNGLMEGSFSNVKAGAGKYQGEQISIISCGQMPVNVNVLNDKSNMSVLEGRERGGERDRMESLNVSEIYENTNNNNISYRFQTKTTPRPSQNHTSTKPSYHNNHQNNHQNMRQNSFKQQQSFINQLNEISYIKGMNVNGQDSNYYFNQSGNKDYKDKDNYYYNQQQKRNTFQNILLDQHHVKRIDTSQDINDNMYSHQFVMNTNNNNQNRQNNNQHQKPSHLPYQINMNSYLSPQDYDYSQQQQQSQQMYLCEVCHRVYPHQQFIQHLKQCQQYQTLLQQKKMIESKLISINQIDHLKRHSHHNSLNSSAIILNKSRSKPKVVKHIEHPILTARQSSHHNHNQNQNQNHHQKQKVKNHQKIQQNNHQPYQKSNYTTRKQNLTQRYVNNRNQNYEQDPPQMNELMNISSISTRPHHINTNCKQPKMKNHNSKPQVSPIKQYHQEDICVQKYQTHNNHNYEQYQHHSYDNNCDDSGFFNNPSLLSHKHNNISNNNSNRPCSQMTSYNTNPRQNNNVGKESMQEQIRKIVEAINQGKSNKSRPDSFTHKNRQPHNKVQSQKKQLTIKTKKHDFY